MRAAYTEAPGGPEQVKVGELPDPDPGTDKLLIRNHAAGLGPWDWKMLAGQWMPLTFPHILGFELAGVVEKAPEGSEFKPGDEVWGRAMGAYAELIVSDGRSIVPKPAGVSFEEAASLVVAGTTAYEGLIDRLNLQAGETVLVTAASGGVGSIAVQVAKAFDARVIGACSAGNFDYVRGLGADEVFDYGEAGWTDKVREGARGGVDVLFDAAGGETGQEALKALKDGGRGAFIAFPNPAWAGEDRGITGEVFSAASSREHLDAINKLIEDGKLKAQVTQTMPLDKAGQALGENQKGHTRGKIVLTT
jgi:NADPH2:quinone reductase